MKIYLVGGAVRDSLLNCPIKERDWVVVGATPEDMLERHFKPVGKDFPVFLHPETGEEYALARTERKSGHGYTGFIFHADSQVTLEEDLARRDLTVNAIARSDEGEYIDPYGGRKDMEARVLRHVSPAFIEDPVRVLRVARFAARYHHLGFRIADETVRLMQEIVLSGEIDHLVPERVWQEIKRALEGDRPQVFFSSLKDCGALAKLIPEVDALFGVPQPEKYHPEIDTGVHCLMSLEQICKLKGSPEARFATLTHDLGKGNTPQNEWPSHKGHEKRGLPLINNLCDRLTVPNSWRELALMVAEFHTHCHRALELRPDTLLTTLEKLDSLRRPERFEQFILCCIADAQGRTGLESRHYPQAEYMREANKQIQAISTQTYIQQGYSGAELGDALRNARRKALEVFKREFKQAQAGTQ